MTEELYALDPRDRDPELVEDDPWAFFEEGIDPEWARHGACVTELLVTASEGGERE